MSEYENLLRSIGSFGPYQRRVFIIVSCVELPVAWAMLLPILVGDKPDYMCPVSQGNSTENGSFVGLNMTTPTSGVAFEEGFCMSDGSSCPGLKFSGEFTSIISEWGLICNQDYAADLITTITMAGVMMGAVLSGQSADTFGRRYVLYVQYLFLVIFSFVSSFSGSWIVYALFRFLVGALCGGILVVSFVLPIEFITPRWRSFCGCIGLWGLGVGTLGVWGYFLRNWRHVIMGTAISSAPLLLTFWFVPESPRWLLKKGRFDDAKKIIEAMAKYNNKPVPDMSSLHNFLKKENLEEEATKKFSYWHLFSTKKLTKSTLVLVFCWFVASSVYYGVSLNVKNLSGDRYINIFLVGIIEIPVLLMVMVLTNKIGRRRTALLLLSVVGVSLISIFGIFVAGKDEELSTVVRVLAMIGKGGISGGWGALMIFSGETYPTLIRNIGIAACNTAARVGGIIAPQIVYLSNKSRSIPFAIFGITALISGIIILILPETVGVPLTDGVRETTVVVAKGDKVILEVDDQKTGENTNL